MTDNNQTPTNATPNAPTTTEYKPNKTTLVKANHSDNPATAKGQCPNQAKEVGIFPLRYSVDENTFLEDPEQNIKNVHQWEKILSEQSNNPLTGQWLTDKLPKLNTRNYTLRQLRKGWLYVWTSQNKLEEYQIQPPTNINEIPTFIKVDLEANQNKEERPATGEAKTLLFFPKNTTVHMAYSAVQWSSRICEQMQQPKNHGKWMRQINLNEYPPAHTEILANISQVAADIFQGKPKAAFKSSLVIADEKYQDKEHARELISNISDDKILASAKDKQVDLFVALDDPFGIIDDILFSLATLVTVKEGYETENQRKTRIAQIVYPMAGLGVDEFIPEQIANDPEQKYQYLQDLVDTHYLDGAYAAYHNDQESKADQLLHETSGTPPPWGGISNGYNYQQRTYTAFYSKWGDKGGVPKSTATTTTATGATKTTTWDDKIIEWERTSSLRRHLKLSESLAHLKERETTLKVYNRCIEKNVTDLIVWLDQLSKEADEVFHDTTQLAQSTELYIHAEKIVNLIQEHSKGREWLTTQLKTPSSLFGLSFFNFNEKLYTLFTRIAENASKDQAINQKDDKSGTGGVKLDNDLSYNLFNRINDTIGGLSNEHLKKLAFFQALDQVAQQSYGVMQKMSITPTIGRIYQRLVIENLALFAALTPKELLPYVTVVTVAPSDRIFLYKNLRFTTDFQSWAYKTNELQKTIDALTQDNIKRSSEGRTGKERYEINKQTMKQNIIEKERLKKLLQVELAKKPVAFVATDASVNTFRTTEELFYRETGQAEAHDRAWARVQSAIKAKTMANTFVQRFNTAASQIKVNFLPVVGLVWNIYNTKDAIDKAKNYSNAKDTLKITSNIAYVGQSVMSVWLGPVWDNYYTTAKSVIDKANATFKAQNIKTVLKLTVKNIATQDAALAVLAPKLLVRVGILNGLLAVAALAEATNTWSDIDSASNGFEKWGQRFKFVVLLVSGGMGATATGNVILALLFDSAWAILPYATPILFWAGVAYLVASVWIQFFHREGLALWLDRSIWGTKCQSPATDEKTQLNELKGLYKILLEPTAQISYTQKYIGAVYGRPGEVICHESKATGFWLQLALPTDLKDTHIKLKTLLVKDRAFFLTNTNLESGYQVAMNALEYSGVWSDPTKPLGKDLSPNPQTPAERKVATYDYENNHDFNRYVYTVWIPYDYEIATILSLQIQFPMDFNQPASLLNAPGIDDQQQTIDFSYQATLNTGTIRHTFYDAKPRQQKLDEGEEKASDFYINNKQYQSDMQSYTLYIGLPVTDRNK